MIDGCALAPFDISSVGEGQVPIHAIGVARVCWMLLPASVADNVVACHSAEHSRGASPLRELKMEIGPHSLSKQSLSPNKALLGRRRKAVRPELWR